MNMQVLTLWEKLNEWSESFKNWIFENYHNPLLWVGIIGVGFILFKTVFSTLNKD